MIMFQLLLVLAFTLQTNNDMIQIEYEYEQGDYFKYAVYAFDGVNSYRYLKHSVGGQEEKFVYNTKDSTATLYTKSDFGRIKKDFKGFSFSENNSTIDYDIEIHENIRKNILGYDCYGIEIFDKRANKKLIVFVTDSFRKIPIQHFINKRFPKIEGFPLQVIANKRNATAFKISTKVDNQGLLKKEYDADYSSGSHD